MGVQNLKWFFCHMALGFYELFLHLKPFQLKNIIFLFELNNFVLFLDPFQKLLIHFLLIDAWKEGIFETNLPFFVAKFQFSYFLFITNSTHLTFNRLLVFFRVFRDIETFFPTSIFFNSTITVNGIFSVIYSAILFMNMKASEVQKQ